MPQIYLDGEAHGHLQYIRQKLAEAEAQANDPKIERLDMEKVMGKYQEKYGYEL